MLTGTSMPSVTTCTWCCAGNFDMLDGHAWLAASLPDVPPRAPTPDGGTFCFQGAVHESLLVW